MFCKFMNIRLLELYTSCIERHKDYRNQNKYVFKKDLMTYSLYKEYIMCK